MPSIVSEVGRIPRKCWVQFKKHLAIIKNHRCVFVHGVFSQKNVAESNQRKENNHFFPWAKKSSQWNLALAFGGPLGNQALASGLGCAEKRTLSDVGDKNDGKIFYPLCCFPHEESGIQFCQWILLYHHISGQNHKKSTNFLTIDSLRSVLKLLSPFHASSLPPHHLSPLPSRSCGPLIG